MKISHNWLQNYFEKPIPSASELTELFTFHSFEVEGVEEIKDDKGEIDNTILDIKVLPDRAHYCLSHAGVALEVSVLTKQPLKPNRIPKGPEATLEIKPTIKIDAPKFCRRYIGRYAELPSIAPSNPHAIVMLKQIGERAIDSVVDATNVVMFDMGQPLHAFDADKVKGAIVVRAARKGEKIELLDSSAGTGREVELLETDHVIADDLGPIAIAGVKGGKRAGITASTKRLIIESANFDPTAVRRTSTRLNLRSESSKRYENEITPELASVAMDNVCALIGYNNRAAKFGPVVDEYPVKAKQTIINFDPAYVEERLGIKIDADEIKGILERLDIKIDLDPKGSSSVWRLTIPFNRLDLTIREDIVEEVGRIYGYEHITGVIPSLSPTGGGTSRGATSVLPLYYASEKIRNILVGLGFSEVSLYTLVSKGEVETAYPLAKDKAFARANLTDGMAVCLEKNALNADLLGLESIKIFEIGRSFTSKGESTMLSIGVGQIKKVKGLKSENLLESALNEISSGFRMSSATALKDRAQKTLVKLHGGGIVCEINLDELLDSESIKIPAGASYTDLDFQPASMNKYKKFSLYPFIVRDIAVFVPEEINADTVWQSIEKGITAANVGELLARHSLFDTFKKDGKVSYAFRMVFQSMERTLTDDEVNKIMGQINQEMKGNEWVVR